jgi:two-component system, NarL family, invasion response regulator UvrY
MPPNPEPIALPTGQTGSQRAARVRTREGVSLMVRLLIADANTLMRTGIRAILSDVLVTRKIAEAQSGAEALACLRTGSWGLCVLDVSLPERGGLEILRHIRKRRYDTKVVFLSSYADRQYAAMALRLGASGYVFKECSQDELREAAQTALAGERYVSPRLSDQLIAQTGDGNPPYTRLSQRELQIFRKLARGTPITVIGRDLSISPKSVSTYRSRILEKIRCANNAEITQYAMREGLP